MTRLRKKKDVNARNERGERKRKRKRNEKRRKRGSDGAIAHALEDAIPTTKIVDGIVTGAVVWNDLPAAVKAASTAMMNGSSNLLHELLALLVP